MRREKGGPQEKKEEQEQEEERERQEIKGMQGEQ